MDKQRQKFVEEINQLRKAVNSTESKYLKKDYQKAIKEMEIELREYDRYQREYKKKLKIGE